MLQVRWDDLIAAEAALRFTETAAVVIPPLLADLGWPSASAGYLSGIRELCSATGTLLIVDESQTGLGRTGKVWAMDHWNVVPDILVMGKGASGGIYPLSYCVMNSRAAAWMNLQPMSMSSSFAGGDLACAVGREVLRITKDPAFLDTVGQSSQYLSDGLQALASRFASHVVGVRQFGLAAAIQFTDPHGGVLMMSALFKQHVWAKAAPFDLSVIRINPPLIIDRALLDVLLEALHNAIVDRWGSTQSPA